MRDEEVPRYKKKSKKKPPTKARHKHEYVNCVFGFNKQKFTKERGFEPEPDMSIGTYCPICGKVGSTFDDADRWVDHHRRGVMWFGYDWTDAAKQEFNAETRSLPYFWLDDGWFQKYVEVEEN